MNPTQTRIGRQLQSLVQADSTLELSLAIVDVPDPGPDEVLVRVQATPINPSDIGLLFGAADMGTAVSSNRDGQPVVTAKIPERAMPGMAARLGQSLPVGNEGAGVVIAAGSSPAAQALFGKTVAVLGGAMYADYRCMPVAQCLVLPEEATAADGASCFVNPLTALGMVETMRAEGHTALVHTAAASNLGQMLNRICLKDGIGLVNIVRKPEQATILHALGAQHVVNATAPSFMEDLTQALVATGATLAFDAIGGGPLAGQILTAMEAAVNRTSTTYSRYGSNVHKQVYIYGGLDMSPTVVTRNFGMTWGMGGWLLFPFLQRAGADTAQRLRARVAAELTTTFASHYSQVISLAQALSLEAIAVYGQRSTASKFLIDPTLG